MVNFDHKSMDLHNSIDDRKTNDINKEREKCQTNNIRKGLSFG